VGDFTDAREYLPARAFGAKVRTALRPFIEYKQAHPDLAPALQEQTNIALRYFCSKEDIKWISLMLWAGADARSLGPSLEEKHTDAPECYVSAMQQACYAGNVDVLRKLKPESGRLERCGFCRGPNSRPRIENNSWRVHHPNLGPVQGRAFAMA
jgi:hypothetical protein